MSSASPSRRWWCGGGSRRRRWEGSPIPSIADLVHGLRARSGELTLLDRLDDVRSRLIWSLLAVALGTGAGFVLVSRLGLLGLLIDPIRPFLGGEKLKYLSPTDPFFVTLKLAVLVGLVLALPLLLYHLWAVVSPLLRAEERRLLRPAMFAAVALFALGAVFCFQLVIPLMLHFTMGFQTGSLEQSIVIGEYLAIVLRMLVAFGLAFELPIVILVLTILRLVTPEFLAARRRHAIAILTVASAIVTPPDLSSMLLMAGPVWGLYEISILLSRAVVARRAAPAIVSEV